MHWIAALKCFALIVVANVTPVAAAWLMGGRFAWPLDGGLTWRDGRPLLGQAKTVRGVVLSIVVTAAAGAALGPGWWLGGIAGAAAMAGDLLSSFVKRRLGFAPSASAPGLDQIPECLLPALACASPMGLTVWDIAVVVLAFSLADLAVSARRRP